MTRSSSLRLGDFFPLSFHVTLHMSIELGSIICVWDIGERCSSYPKNARSPPRDISKLRHPASIHKPHLNLWSYLLNRASTHI